MGALASMLMPLPSIKKEKMRSHIIKNLSVGIFEKGLAGVRGYIKNIPIPLAAGKSEYQLEEKSQLEKNYVIGLAVNSPSNTATARASNTAQLPALSIIESAKITIRTGDTVVVDNLPIADVLKSNANGYWYDLHISDRVTLSESKVYISNDAAIQANDQLELTFLYVKPKKR